MSRIAKHTQMMWLSTMTRGNNLSKSEFGRAQVTYLGHVLGQGQVKPVCAKLEAIAHCPRPENKEGLMRFLGMAGYYRRFCSNFATVAELLTQLLSKKVQFIWNERCENAFKESYVTECPCIDSAWFQLPVKVDCCCKWCRSWCHVVTRGWWRCVTSSLFLLF